MTSFVERLGVPLLAAALAGCVSGHLLDAARLREVPTGVTAVALDGDALVVLVATRTVTDFDRPAGRGTTRARVALEALEPGRPIDRLGVRFERVRRPLPGVPVSLAGGSSSAPPGPVVTPGLPAAPPGPVARLTPGPPAVLRLYGVGPAVRVLPLDALTRAHYRPWVWALMPSAVAIDVVFVPPLLVLAPIVMAIGN